MSMKKTLFLVLALIFTSGIAWAAKTTYIVTNKRLNYVKLKEVSPSVALARGMTHPATVDEQGLKAALASINMARGYLIKKEVDTQQVFDERAVDFLAPALVQAFAQAAPNEEIVFSYLSKNPLFILRNDRLNIAEAWIHDNELHVKFEKLYAKISGDIDKRGYESKAVASATGLRIKLELAEGQKLGIDDPEEIVLDMHHNYVKKPEEKKAPEGVTMSGEKVPMEGEPAAAAEESAPKDKKAKKTAKAEKASLAVAEAAGPASQAPVGAKERLERLDQLKKDGLINKKEYEEKRKEIIKEL